MIKPPSQYDALVIGSGPNGLAAAVSLVQQGLHTKVYEAKKTIGGGTRTKNLTLPGFKHDVCSAIHPMAMASPFFRSLPLEEHGLQWIRPELPLCHPLDDQPAVVLHAELDKMRDELDADGPAWQKLIAPLSDNWSALAPQLLAPFSLFPSNPILMARFGLQALKSGHKLSGSAFKTDRARALFAGLAAHSIMDLDRPLTSAIGMVLGAIAHVYNWPFPKGGSQEICNALASCFKSMGGEIETGRPITNVSQLPPAKAVFFNLTPRQVIDIAGGHIPTGYVEKLRKYRYGAGVFKLDLALDGPIPWKDERCLKAGTVHLGGSLEEIVASEKAMSRGTHHPKPYVLVAQQSLFDETRAPEGKHTVWAYCHVPGGSDRDMTEVIENQIERFAPGFRDRILARHSMNTKQMQTYNANYIGGDINGGIQDLKQLFTRPVKLFDPYHVPDTSFYFASSSAPPGGGVHGMSGYHAAQSALKREFNIDNSIR